MYLSISSASVSLVVSNALRASSISRDAPCMAPVRTIRISPSNYRYPQSSGPYSPVKGSVWAAPLNNRMNIGAAVPVRMRQVVPPEIPQSESKRKHDGRGTKAEHMYDMICRRASRVCKMARSV